MLIEILKSKVLTQHLDAIAKSKMRLLRAEETDLAQAHWAQYMDVLNTTAQIGLASFLNKPRPAWWAFKRYAELPVERVVSFAPALQLTREHLTPHTSILIFKACQPQAAIMVQLYVIRDALLIACSHCATFAFFAFSSFPLDIRNRFTSLLCRCWMWEALTCMQWQASATEAAAGGSHVECTYPQQWPALS